MAWPRHPFIYEINTWPWLTELGARGQTPIDLSDVPGPRWDAIAEAGFDAVWLMGVWQRSAAGVAVALADPDLVGSFRQALPDWTPDDVVGSPYCIRDYVVDPRLGGRSGLAAARVALADRGLALVLDFVPNHVAPDHPWTSTHPEYFVRGTSDDLLADPGSYLEFDGTVWANGRDPYFPAWRDVLQLNAFHSGVRDRAIDTLRDVADQCDGVRCDMAMLVTNDVFARTWGERVGEAPSTDYWTEVIGAVRRAHPDFAFIAEAYWGTEESLLHQGFDWSYDKGWYDGIVAGDADGLRTRLTADALARGRSVRFVENHDEPRAAAIMDPAKTRAAMVATMTQPGVRLVHHGQFEGRKVHLPVFLGRSPREDIDAESASFHRELFATLRDTTFRAGAWRPCEPSGELLAWGWEGERRRLVVVNLSAATASGVVRAPWDGPAPGLHVELDPWGWQILEATSGHPLGLAVGPVEP
jgi:glycosidase